MKQNLLFGLLSISLICLQWFAPAIAATDPLLTEAEQAFVAKRFHAAEDLLTAEIAKNPANQEAHLLLARTYVQLLDNKAAEREYTDCMKCNPFSPAGRLAHQESINIAGRTASDKASPTDDVKTVSKSVDAINHEANELKGMYGTASNTMTPNYATSGGAYPSYNASRYAGRMPAGMPQNTAQAGINGMYGQPGAPYTIPIGGAQPYAAQPYGSQPYGAAAGGAYNPAMAQPGAPMMPNYFTQPQMPLSSRNGRGRSFANVSSSFNPNQQSWSSQSSDYQVQQLRRQQADVQSAQSAQESANNLERLMAEKPNSGSGTPKLRALGTNLFVRYYGSHDQDGSTASTPPADPVQELKAKELKFSDMK
jgi:hypothetical protein